MAGIKILAVIGFNRKQSLNRKLFKCVQAMTPREPA